MNKTANKISGILAVLVAATALGASAQTTETAPAQAAVPPVSQPAVTPPVADPAVPGNAAAPAVDPAAPAVAAADTGAA